MVSAETNALILTIMYLHFIGVLTLDCSFLAVPCSSASESTDCPAHSRCLTQSTTGQSICLQSCYRDNGGCAAGDVCITELLVDDCQYGEECETDVTCRSLNGT